MKDITVKLTVKSGSTPKCLKVRSVAYAIKPKVEAELDGLVKISVLEPLGMRYTDCSSHEKGWVSVDL